MNKVKYKVLISFEVEHEYEGLDRIKSDREFSEDLAQMVCDEATTCGAVCSYDIKESCIEIKTREHKETENIIYKDFMKKGYN